MRQSRKIRCSKTVYRHHHRLHSPGWASASSARQVAHDNKVYVLCVLDNQGYSQTRARAHANTHTHTQYVILIAFQLQHGFREGASKFRYTYIACLVKIHVNL